MNRRDFFKVAAATPIAAPMIAKAASESLLSHGIAGRISTVRLDATHLNTVLTGKLAAFDLRAARERAIPSDRIISPKHGRLVTTMIPDELHVATETERLPRGDVSVITQMQEHDLFEPQCFT